MSDIARRRTVAVVGPQHSGKTTLVEAILHRCGAIPRRGAVADGTTTTDFEPESVARAQSTSVGFAYAACPNIDLTLIDTPGYVDFLEETKLALLAADAVVVVVDGDTARAKQVRGIIAAIEERALPHCFFVNKLDRPGSDFRTALDELIALFGRRVVAEDLPIGEGEGFRGYIDLAEQQAFVYENGSVRTVPIADELQEPVHEARRQLLEALGDFDDHLLEELLEGIEPPLDEVRADLRAETVSDQIVPVLVGAGLKGIGIDALLDVIEKQFPAPAGDPAKSVVAQICKTYVHPQTGKISVARVFEGTLRSDATLFNVSRDGLRVRAAGLARLQGRKQDPVQSAGPGELVAIARLDDVRTGDTLAADAKAAPRDVPATVLPLFAVAIKPKDKFDEAKLSQSLNRILEEDPTLRVSRADFTNELQLLGLGEVHVTTALQRIARKYNLALETHSPTIAYRETITQPTEINARYKHQTGGHGQFGNVTLRIEPRERGHGVTFSEAIVGGVVPRQFFPAVEKGVHEALARGPLAGFPVTDLHVTLIDGSYHDVDSSEQSFRTAGSMAIRDGLPKCGLTLLEPVVYLEALVPEDSASAILGGITSKRGHVLSFGPAEGTRGFQQVCAHVPQAEMVQYVTELRTATSGLGTYTWRHERFDPAPPKVAKSMQEAVAAAP